MPRQKPEFHVTGSGKGPPTFDDLVALAKSVSGGPDLTPTEYAEGKAEYDAMVKRKEAEANSPA